MRRMFIEPDAGASAAILERSAVPERYRWNLDDLYPSAQAWKAAKDAAAAQIDAIVGDKGRLTASAEQLAAALTRYFDAAKTLSQLSSYAQQFSDEDARIAERQGMMQEMQHLVTVFKENTAFIVPELTAAPPELLEAYLEQTPALEDVRMFLQEIQRNRAHTLSEPEEKLLAGVGDLTGAIQQVFSIFENAEFPFPTVTLSTGETITLTASNYVKHRASPAREDRRTVMHAFFETFGKYKNTFGANLVAKLKSDFFYAKSRKHPSCLHAALHSDNIPVSVYENLIQQIRRSLPTLRRFLGLKRKLLGLDALHYYDLYAALVKDVDLRYTVEDAQERMLAALQPLGSDYAARLRFGLDHRWIDYMPTAGKRSGAYSNGGAYDAHPYILMNWNDDYNSLGTLAHEIGHTMHSDLSNRAQPFAKADYSIFVAEIASTFNENLVDHYLIEQVTEREQKLYLLGHQLEGFRGTIFRQVQFAEFEWEIHKKIEAGESLTGESLSEMYLALTRAYYGHDQGVCVVDDPIAYEWAFIPHFYYNFYVFQYATSLIYSTALCEKVLRGEAGSVEKYLRLLRSGGSNYPIDLVRESGLEPLSSEAFELTMQRIEHIMDDIELLAAV